MHAYICTYICTYIHPVLSCLSTAPKGHVAFQKRKGQEQQEQATTLPVYIWFTGNGHGAPARKPEDTL